MSLSKDGDQSVSADTQQLVREGYEFEVMSNDPESVPDIIVWELRYMTTRMTVLVRAALEEPSTRLSRKDTWDKEKFPSPHGWRLPAV
ncbi:hypothetical protein CMUS01_10985 [Colletotrichum musicola]|uniref:Uncharacterized protein n=1 Tax=Colletotrichum musicola TaxID=2175873 RepID=A0A8H6K1S9_9PEZI|nr:hypothetical protein CMUS01_10985 [Colletotrichum musicola]